MDHSPCSIGNQNQHEISTNDQISSLPHDILVKILTLLTTRAATRTSILSHQWLGLWKEVPLLHFEDPYARYFKLENATRHARKFIKWLHHVLQEHKRSYLREFKVVYDLDKRYQAVIDKWLEFAFARRIQHLNLSLLLSRPVMTDNYEFPDEYTTDNYAFPHHLLDQCCEGSSKDLAQAVHLGHSIPAKVDFSCLKSLFLRGVDITGETIELLLLKSPFLESVSVISSMTLVYLVVSGPSLRLKKLLIHECLNVESIRISDSNLVSLTISEITEGEGLRLCNVPMLNEVRIDGELNYLGSILSSQLSCCCRSQPKVVTLRSRYPKAVLRDQWFPILRNIRRLVVIFCEWGYKPLVRLVSLMNACPNLVEFVFEKEKSGKQEPPEVVGKEHEQVSFTCLKLVEMHGYEGRECEDELVMTIIEKSVALEKIVIAPHKNRVTEARKHAAEQLQCLVPQHLELAIL